MNEMKSANRILWNKDRLYAEKNKLKDRILLAVHVNPPGFFMPSLCETLA